MPCDLVTLPDGGRAFICSTGRAKRCACGARAPFLCDWKVPGKRSGTCDAPICAAHAASPAPDKHLCPTHDAAYAAWLAQRQNRRQAQSGAGSAQP